MLADDKDKRLEIFDQKAHAILSYDVKPGRWNMNLKLVGYGLSLVLLASNVAYANNSTRELPSSEFRGTMIVMTRGTVITVDKAAMKIRISHQGNEDIQIPAAITEFGAVSADMLVGFEAGAAVFFIADRVAEKPVVIRLAPRRPNGFTY